MYIDILNAITAVIEFTNAIRSATEQKRPIRHCDRVIDAIRGIYFSPRGILPVLKDLHAGKEIPDRDLQKALRDFADGQQPVEAQLRGLDWHTLRQDLRFSIQTMERLERISYEKIGLRSEIIRFVQLYWAGERKPRGWRDELGELIVRIEGLNEAIREMDELLNPNAAVQFD